MVPEDISSSHIGTAQNLMVRLCLLALWLNIVIPVGSIGWPKLYSVGNNFPEALIVLVYWIVAHGKQTLDVAHLLRNLVHVSNVVNQVGYYVPC